MKICLPKFPFFSLSGRVFFGLLPSSKVSWRLIVLALDTRANQRRHPHVQRGIAEFASSTRLITAAAEFP